MFFSIALKSTGAGWSWGANASGQLGTGNVTSYSSPVLVVGSHSFTQISAFNYDTPTNGTSFGLKSNNGSVWAWGWNSYGQLGVNNTTAYSSPILVVGSHSFTRVLTSGNHTAFLKADGSVWCSGKNDFGQLGDNSQTNRSSPILVVGSHSFIQIAVGLGGSHSLGLKADGAVWAWGTNASGQLGTGNTTSYSSPVLVVGAHSFSEITAGLSTSVGLKADGSVWCWGSNNYGQLGDNSRTNRSSPVLVVGSHSFNGIISAYNMTRALKASTGAAWSWGENTSGQLGTGDTTSYSSPVIVVGSHSFTQIAAGIYHSLGLKADGAVWSWGSNSNGQLGDNSITGKSSPVLVVGSHVFTILMNQMSVMAPSPVTNGLYFASSSSQYATSVSNFTPPENCSTSFWISTPDSTNVRNILGHSDVWGIYLDGTNSVCNGMNFGTTLRSSIKISVGSVYHVVTTRASDNTQQIFIDGALNTTGGGGTASPGAAPLILGRDSSAANYLDGYVEDLRVYDRVLSLAEVETIYACKGNDNIVYGMLHRYLLNEGSQGAVASGIGALTDVGITGNSLTPTNGPVYSGSVIKTRRYIEM